MTFSLWRGLAVGASLFALSAGASAADDAAGDLPLSLRLSPGQYKQIIADVFGPTISIQGRFEPEIRTDGLLAIGARSVSISDTGIERYDDMARGVAAQVIDARHRDTFVHCKPQAANAADDACAKQFISLIGRLLYRRSLNENELGTQVRVAAESAAKLHDFYAGLSTSLAEMLISPDFLFRYKRTETDASGQRRLDGYSKASVLSFFLWNSVPDDALLKAAENGSIHTQEGLQRQVDRMISSSRMEGGLRAFFSDMLGFSEFEVLAKDPTFFPRYTITVKEDSQEQTLKTIVDHVMVRRGDYRDLFTTPHTYLTRSLAALYNVPLPEKTDNGQPMHWQPYTYKEGDPRAGLLAQASFVALYSPAGRSSPTARGKALRENILCQKVPPPPGNVDFKFVQDTSNPQYKTTRDRLTAHRSEAMCAGCHKITDPIGLALENFDSAGGFRTKENGVVIDTTGELSGVKFEGPIGLAKVLHDDPAVVSCVAKRAFGFAAGRLPASQDADWPKIEAAFKDSKYNVLELMRRIALSDVVYTVPARQVAAAQK